MEKIFDLQARVFAPTSRVLTTQFAQKTQSVLVPSSKSFNDERLEEDALLATVFSRCHVLINFFFPYVFVTAWAAKSIVHHIALVSAELSIYCLIVKVGVVLSVY